MWPQEPPTDNFLINDKIFNFWVGEEIKKFKKGLTFGFFAAEKEIKES